MYNKIFTKILDSSIWLEPEPTRIVWLTCIAAMDEDGFCAFAAPANLAHRANVSLTTCMSALSTLEGTDVNSSDPDNEGRRLERVPGGWIVLNARKYRDLVTRAVSQEQNRNRVRRFRDKKRTGNRDDITAALPAVTCNASEAVSESGSETEREKSASVSTVSDRRNPARDDRRDPFTDGTITERAARFIERYQQLYTKHRNARYLVRETRDYAASVPLCATWTDDAHLDKLAAIFLTTDHKFAEEGSRTIPQFAALASWADGKLAEWEAKRSST